MRICEIEISEQMVESAARWEPAAIEYRCALRTSIFFTYVPQICNRLHEVKFPETMNASTTSGRARRAVDLRNTCEYISRTKTRLYLRCLSY